MTREPPIPQRSGMKLARLKERVQALWEGYTRYYGQSVILPEQFKSEIRQAFGDLRRRATWEAAYCRYAALHSKVGLLDADRLILHDFNFQPDEERYEYRHRIFDEWLSLPAPYGLTAIKTGLEILFEDYTAEEWGEADGFFKLVQESAGRELGGDAVGLVRAIPASALAG